MHTKEDKYNKGVLHLQNHIATNKANLIPCATPLRLLAAERGIKVGSNTDKAERTRET